MNMMMVLKKVSLSLLAVLAFLNAGCEKDFYDPSYEVEPVIKDIPDGFNWSMISTTHLTVNVNDQYGGNYFYVVEVYDANPIFNPEAKLLAKGIARKDEPLVTMLDFPQFLNTIYIAQILKKGTKEERVILACEVTSTDLKCDFAATSTAKSLVSNAPAVSGPQIISETVPEGAEPIDVNKKKNTLTPGHTYVIKEKYDGEIVFSPGARTYLYVNATWTLSRSFRMEDGLTIVVLNGASIDFKNAGVVLTTGGGSPELMIARGAKFNSTKRTIDLEFTNQSKLINEGDFNAQNLKLTASGSLYNRGVFTAKEIELTNTSARIVNDHFITTESLRLTNGTLENNCKVTVNQFVETEGATLNLNSNTLFITKKITVNKTQVLMKQFAILDAVDAHFVSNNILNGVGPDFALARFEDVEFNYGGVECKGNLELENTRHNENDQWNTYYKLTPPARMVDYGKPTLAIPSGDCTGSGSTPEGGAPADPDFPVEVPLGDVYTYAMEDNWPIYGDYDLNDLVLDLQISYKLNESGYVDQMELMTKLRAVGGSRRVGAAFQLDGVAAGSVASVDYEGQLLDRTLFAMASNGAETEQTKAVIPLFDNAHKLLTGIDQLDLINTIQTKMTYPSKSVKAMIHFTEGKVKPADVSIHTLNFFIATAGSAAKRTEIHLGGYEPTDKADRSLFGKNNDNSNQTPYIGKDNLVWGIMTPISFQYPLEWNNVMDAYPEFSQWAVSGGNTNVNWYSHPQPDLIYHYSLKD